MLLNNPFYKNITFNIYAIYVLAWMSATSTILGAARLSQYFHESIYQVQFWNGIMVLFFSCSQVIAGPISDSVGRKKTLISALSLTIAGLFLCIISRHFIMFVAGLLILGIGSGPLAILARAIAKDIYKKEKLFYVYSVISFMTVAAWVASSGINAIAQFLESWQLTYIILLLYSLILLLVFNYFFFETLPIIDRRVFSISSFLNSYYKILTNKSYVKYNYIWSILYACLVGGIYSYLPVLLLQSQELEKKLTFFMSSIMFFYALGIFGLRCTIGKMAIKSINKYSISIAALTIPYFFLLLIFDASAALYVIGFCIFSFSAGSISSVFITQAMSCVKEKSISGYAAAVVGISGSFGSSLISTILSLSGYYQGIVLVLLVSSAIISSAYLILHNEA